MSIETSNRNRACFVGEHPRFARRSQGKVATLPSFLQIAEGSPQARFIKSVYDTRGYFGCARHQPVKSAAPFGPLRHDSHGWETWHGRFRSRLKNAFFCDLRESLLFVFKALDRLRTDRNAVLRRQELEDRRTVTETAEINGPRAHFGKRLVVRRESQQERR